MSTENQSPIGLDNPIGNLDPPRSKKKFWIFGGLGCFGLLALVCVGGALFIYNAAVRPALEFQSENINSAVAMPEVEQALGAPVTAGPPEQVQSEDQKFTFRVPLTGSQAEGTLVFGGTMEGINKWTRDFIYLEVNEQQIDLDVDAMFDLDISEGE